MHAQSPDMAPGGRSLFWGATSFQALAAAGLVAIASFACLDIASCRVRAHRCLSIYVVLKRIIELGSSATSIVRAHYIWIFPILLVSRWLLIGFVVTVWHTRARWMLLFELVAGFGPFSNLNTCPKCSNFNRKPMFLRYLPKRHWLFWINIIMHPQ